MSRSFHSDQAYAYHSAITKTQFTSPWPIQRTRNVCALQPSMTSLPKRQNLTFENASNTPRKSRRKTSEDIRRDRKYRAQKNEERRPIVAQWSGAVLAESSHYEFLDGRFFFPSSSVRWDFMENSDKHKFFNPIGKAQLFDIVLRSQSQQRNGAIIARNRGAVMRMDDVKGGWESMKGYTAFCKGVKLFQKPKVFEQRILPGHVRPPFHACGLPDECDRFDGFEYSNFTLHVDDHNYDSIDLGEGRIS